MLKIFKIFNFGFAIWAILKMLQYSLEFIFALRTLGLIVNINNHLHIATKVVEVEVKGHGLFKFISELNLHIIEVEVEMLNIEV